jgi:hypothetical protein
MSALRYTLLADGPSDRCLIWLINWVLAAIPQVATHGFTPQVAQPSQFKNTDGSLSIRMAQAIVQYPCDILLVHRDAEAQPHALRIAQIAFAAAQVSIPPYVAVVPVRMTEAWLLLDVPAIRKAADNPNGGNDLHLPSLRTLESLPDPKKVLRDLLVLASEKTGQRKDQFERDLPIRCQRVAELIPDFAPLRQLPAFQVFERDLRNASLAWAAP